MCHSHATSPHGLVTVSNFLPVFGSVMCTEHAVHGSKLWTVRRALIGFSMSVTGTPIRACSSGPCSPLPLIGARFQVDGMMIW